MSIVNAISNCNSMSLAGVEDEDATVSDLTKSPVAAKIKYPTKPDALGRTITDSAYALAPSRSAMLVDAANSPRPFA